MKVQVDGKWKDGLLLFFIHSLLSPIYFLSTDWGWMLLSRFPSWILSSLPESFFFRCYNRDEDRKVQFSLSFYFVSKSLSSLLQFSCSWQNRVKPKKDTRNGRKKKRKKTKFGEDAIGLLKGREMLSSWLQRPSKCLLFDFLPSFSYPPNWPSISRNFLCLSSLDFWPAWAEKTSRCLNDEYSVSV